MIKVLTVVLAIVLMCVVVGSCDSTEDPVFHKDLYKKRRYHIIQYLPGQGNYREFRFDGILHTEEGGNAFYWFDRDTFREVSGVIDIEAFNFSEAIVHEEKYIPKK